MRRFSSQTVFNSFLYGGASALLAIDLFFLVKALFQNNFVPVVPILAGILITAGLLLVVYAERHAREEDKREVRRLSRVAHQLESPLHALQDDIEYLVREADKLPAELRMKLKKMDTKSKVLLENIRDVFLMQRASQGSIAKEERVYDLCALVHESVERSKTLASARNVQITQKAHCQHAPVQVDRQLFFIALGHLLENGILYTLTPGLVNVVIMRGKNEARVIVQDRGIGITPKDADSVFLPFSRGHKAEQFDADGIGVGLTLAKQIVEEFGGSLRWKSRTASTGTEFEIRLPLAEKG